MKALKIEPQTQHLVLLEEGDRFVALVDQQSAIVIGEAEGEEMGIEVSVHFPALEEGEEVPFSVMMSACVREFLDDPQWIEAAQQRLKEKSAKAAAEMEDAAGNEEPETKKDSAPPVSED